VSEALDCFFQYPIHHLPVVKDGKLTGQVKMGAEPKPLTLDVGGPLFADGGGAYEVMAALPLAEGYETAFRNVDVLTQKPKVMQLKVLGTESATVPAGTFDCWKAEVTSPDDGQKSTFWVAKDTRRVVKLTSVLPRMNGATLISEMQK